ncbi:MAG: bifunctional nuclease domain-containing protein [Chloroflexota bacterium]
MIFRIARRSIRALLRGTLNRWPTTLLALVMVLGGVYALSLRGTVPGLAGWLPLPSTESVKSSTGSDMREMSVIDIAPAASGEQVNLTLKEKSGNRRIVMSVGRPEAIAIATGMSGTRNRRGDSTTAYDLTKSLVEELGGTVTGVVVNNVDRDSFYAKVIMNTESRQIEVDFRPSDAIALAIRTKAPIYAESSVLDKVGVASTN